MYNKIDSVSLDFLDQLAREPHTVVMSCELDLGIQDVVDRCWKELQLMRIYTKRYAMSICLNLGANSAAEKEKSRISVRPSSYATSPPSRRFATRCIEH